MYSCWPSAFKLRGLLIQQLWSNLVIHLKSWLRPPDECHLKELVAVSGLNIVGNIWDIVDTKLKNQSF